MKDILTALGLVIAAAAVIYLIILAAQYIVYRIVFLSDNYRKKSGAQKLTGEQYDPYLPGIMGNIERIRRVPYESHYCTSHDGLKLFARYYHVVDGAPIAIWFHGYRGDCIFDGSGGFCICEEIGINMLFVDQRANGSSEGKTISFGINERYDCLNWINYVLEHFGKDTQIMLMGISMGAATVMMASGLELPDNVRGIVADCGFSSPKDIICSVCRQMKLSPALVYPLIKASAKTFGRFDLEAASAEEALKKCKVPIFMVHGEEDRFVPCEMSRVNFAACTSEKKLMTVPNAGHGMSFSLDGRGYRRNMYDFIDRIFEGKTGEGDRKMDISRMSARPVVLFDLDGTLLPMNMKNFEKTYFGGLCRRFGEFAPDELVAGIWAGTKAMFKNDGTITNREAFAAVFSQQMGIDYYEKEEHFTEYYRTDFEKCAEQCVITDISRQIVDTLQSKGYTVAVATNPIFPQVATYARLRWLGMDAGRFPLVTTFEDSHFAKPNPKYYSEICEKLGVEPTDCIMIGNDVTEDGAAKALGIEVAIVTECLLNSQHLPIDNFYSTPTLEGVLEWAKSLPEIK